MKRNNFAKIFIPTHHSLLFSGLAILTVILFTAPSFVQQTQKLRQQEMQAYTDDPSAELSSLFGQITKLLRNVAPQIDESCPAEQIRFLRQKVFGQPILGELGIVTLNGQLICSSWHKFEPSLSVPMPPQKHRFSINSLVTTEYLQQPTLVIRYMTDFGYAVDALVPIISLSEYMSKRLKDSRHDIFLALIDTETSEPIWKSHPNPFSLQEQASDAYRAFKALYKGPYQFFPVSGRYHYEGEFDDGLKHSLYIRQIDAMPNLALLATKVVTNQETTFNANLLSMLAGYLFTFLALIPIINYSEHYYLDPKRRIQKGLNHHQFFNVYQPLIDTATNRVVSLEVLIRWQDPEKGLVMPNAFLPNVEAADLGVALTLYQIAEIKEELFPVINKYPEISIAINIDHQHLTDEAFINAMLQLAKDMPNIRVELTEHDVIDVEDLQILANLSKLNLAGIQVAVDDFGTGYSGVAYLNHFPINQLKIDRSFVSIIGVDSPHASVLEAVVALGKQLDLQLVAEGVETPVQAQRLKELDVYIHQGWLYARPMKVDDLEQHLNGSQPECG